MVHIATTFSSPGPSASHERDDQSTTVCKMVDIAPCLADPELVFDVLPVDLLEALPVDLLEALPVDLLHRLFTLLLLPDNKDEAVSRSHSSAPLHSSMAGLLAACSQHLRAAYLTLPEHAFRAPALALLGLSQTCLLYTSDAADE